jgi:hypothetical protein
MIFLRLHFLPVIVIVRTDVALSTVILSAASYDWKRYGSCHDDLAKASVASFLPFWRFRSISSSAAGFVIDFGNVSSVFDPSIVI